MNDPEKTPRRGIKLGIYWLPNFLTTTSLFCGMYSIICAFQGQFTKACILLVASSILDVLDGLVAKKANATSDFGAQLDSLSDMVCFGVAPALLVWLFSYEMIGHSASLAAFTFTAMTAMRLARFNTQLQNKEKSQSFQGLPSPAAAAMVFCGVWSLDTFAWHSEFFHWTLVVVTIFAALLMVSNIRYPGVKHLGKEKVPFVGLLALLLIFILIIASPEIVLWLFFTGYSVFGIIYTLVLRRQRRIQRNLKKSSLPNDTPS